MKKLLISIKRWFEALVFKIKHKQGLAEKYALEVLASENGKGLIEETPAFQRFVQQIAKIERSRISEGEKRHRIENEKRKLWIYGFNYAYPSREVRIEHEEIRKMFKKKWDRDPKFFEIFA